ncbi:hypothetical protein GCM10010309_07510 [Streptomyces violaceochromogenes]|nr:hypothetical protein GCM10010309_07510 [Streptomyces violaceochromogenes]
MGRVQLEGDLLVGRGPVDVRAARVGMEVGPPEPFSHGAWFQVVAATLTGG